MKRKNEPAFHLIPAEFLLVYLLGTRILTQGIYFNVLMFTNPPVAVGDFKTALKLLGDLITSSKGNSNDKKSRDAASVALHELMKILLPYVSVTAQHDINVILASGFDCNNQPQKTQIPQQPVIKEVCDGPEPGTYKAKLERKKKKIDVKDDPVTHPKNVKYVIEISTTPSDATSWKMIEFNLVSTKLIFSDIIAAKLNYIRIYGTNSAGKGKQSVPFQFSPKL